MRECEMSALTSIISQKAVLGLRGRRIGERIAAAVIIDLVAAHVGIDGQQRVGVEGVLIAGRDVPGQHALFLVLANWSKLLGI